MATLINVPSGASSTQTITFNKSSYEIEFQYNSRFSYWTFSLYRSSGEVILLGEKVMTNKEYLRRYAKDDLVGGYLLTASTDNVPVTRDNFGLDRTHTELFVTYKELEDAISI